jgi:glucokinase
MTPRVLGIEIGGTKLQAAIGLEDGTIEKTIRGSAPSGGADAILKWYERELPAFIKGVKGIGCIGIGFGGPVNSMTGEVLTSHQVEGWSGFPLRDWFEDRFEIETHVFNDSNAAGWAEYCLGAGAGTEHFLYMNIGSGIGGALVLDGLLHNGQGFGASELGHMYVPDWEQAGVPRKLEDLCSGWSIERRQRAMSDPDPGTPLGALCEGKSANITCAMLGLSAQQGDPRACEEIEHVARSVGLALANAVTLIHPERIALGGGVALMGDILIEPIRRYANQFAFGPFQNRFEIVPCALGESVVLAGAILLTSEEVL